MRLLTLILGNTVYTASIILFVFLTGLAIGAGTGSFIAVRIRRPRIAFGVCQIGLTAAIAWTAYMIADSVSYWPIDPLLSLSTRSNFQIDALRTFWTILPATLLWGSQLAIRTCCVRARGAENLRVRHGGAAAGAIAFSVVLIPSMGTRFSEQLLIGLSAAAAFACFQTFKRRAAAVALAMVLFWSVPEMSWQTFAYGRRMATILRSTELNTPSADPPRVLYRGEGSRLFILVTQENGQRTLYINGRAEASHAGRHANSAHGWGDPGHASRGPPHGAGGRPWRGRHSGFVCRVPPC
jgi:spermidine synthase